MPSPAVRLDERFRLDGVRVLVVDDTPYVRDVVRDILTEDGAKVTAVASAEEAAGAEGKRAIAIEQVRADSEILTAPADQRRGTTGVLPIDQVCRRST